MKTVKELLAHCRKACDNNVQYVYGAKMQVLSLAQIKNLQKTYGVSYVWRTDLNKAGHLCCDCSGLISSCTGVTRNSSNYAATALATVSMAELKKNWKKYIGWGLWMQGHIGVVSDREGYYFAMDGSSRNMVHNPLYMQNWTKCIKIIDINYDSDISDEPERIKGITIAAVNIRLEPNKNPSSKILTTIPKDKEVQLLGIAKTGWYQVAYNSIIGYASNVYISTSVKGNLDRAFKRLAVYKVMASPEYWQENHSSIPYLEELLVRSSIVIKKEKKSNAIINFNEALKILATSLIITDGSYWVKKISQVPHLRELILNIANTIA